jgi:Mg-chelatase subunit ChlD
MYRSVVTRAMRVAVALTVVFATLPVPQALAITCKDVHAIWATGANNQPGGDDFTRFTGDLGDRIQSPVTFSAYALGTGFGGFRYQPTDDVGLFLQLTTGPLSLGPFNNSVQSGIDELNAYLTDRAAQCGNEVYVLGGWSEGADVVSRGLSALPQSVRDRIAFVELFGDPVLDTGNWRPPGTPPIGGFLPSCFFGKRPWVRGSAPCWITGGILGSHTPYVPSDMEQRVGSWCREQDAACDGSLFDFPASFFPPTNAHYRYFDPNSDSAFAAEEAAERLKTFVPAHASSFDVTWDQFVVGQAAADLVIVFDTTGSMSGAIADAKTQAATLAQQWTTLFTNGRVGLVDFKDQGDAYVSRVDLQLTSDSSAFQTSVNALSATGGGDTPEAQLSGIMTALDGMAWANGATKAVVVITDAPGKDPEPITNFTRASVDQHALQIDPVAIYGVNVSTDPAIADWMAPMASATAGGIVTLAAGQSLSDALSALFDSVHANPVAKLDGPYVAQTGTAINFSAAGSFDASATITSYGWDFDGNGTVDRTTTTPTTTYTYPGQFHGVASVRVAANDSRSALATTNVTVDSVGLANLQPIAPISAAATVSGSNQVTVNWTAAANDRADGYKIYRSDSVPARFTMVADPHSAVIDGLDLSQPVQLYVVASNAYGDSAAVITPPVGGAAPVTTTRVSESSTHGQGNGVSDKAFISSDGRYVTFRSSASNLVANDTNSADDVFVKDRQTNGIVAASSTSTGVIANARSDDGSISADGLHVAFRSQASNLVANDTNGTAWDTFVKDLQTGAVDRVSVSSSGAQANGASVYPVLSADGRWVAFRSDATNLISGDTNGVGDIYLRDRQTNTTTRISVATGGGQSNGKSDRPTISNDGRYIVYESDATNLASGDTNGKTDIFRYDRTTGTTIRVSVSSAGVQGNGISDDAAISGDGGTVAYESAATNLVSGDTNAKVDVFVRTIATSGTTRGSVGAAGVQGNNDSSDPSLSLDGTKLGFASNATNLISGDTNSRSDIFVRDLAAGTNTRFSVATDGTAGNNTSQDPWLSADAGTVAFQSVASNLAPNDTNNTSDIFVRGPAMGPG